MLLLFWRNLNIITYVVKTGNPDTSVITLTSVTRIILYNMFTKSDLPSYK